MSIVVICILTVLAIFVSAYLAKRRFGLLGLALAAGSLLSKAWTYEAGLMASALGILSNPVSSAIISAVIILLPAYLLLSRARTYKTSLGRLVGAALFTVLALAFMVDPLEYILILQGTAGEIYNQLLNYKDLIVGVGLIVAVLDLFFSRSAELSEKKHEH